MEVEARSRSRQVRMECIGMSIGMGSGSNSGNSWGFISTSFWCAFRESCSQGRFIDLTIH